MKLEDAHSLLFGNGLPCTRCKGKGVIPDPNFRSFGVEEAHPNDVPCPDCCCGDNQGESPGLVRASRDARAIAALIQATGWLELRPEVALPALQDAQTLATEVLSIDFDSPEIRDIARRLLTRLNELRDCGYF